MPRITVSLMVGLAACAVFNATGQSDLGSGEMSDWRLASGKAPSRAEYAAMVAACQDGAVQHTAATTLNGCLAGLGLKRAE
jgi:hypothetical protein